MTTMKVHSKPWRLAPRSAACALLTITLPGMAQDLSDAKGAIDKLKQLPGSVQKVREVVKAANFGPFAISGSCSYNWVWYCFGTNCTTFSWGWKFPNYAWLRGALDQRYQNIQSVSSQFDGRFSPVKSWLLNTLPGFSQQFDTTATRMQAEDATIRKAGATPAEIEKATLNILQALDQTTGSLHQGLDQLKAGTSGLAIFNRQLSGTFQTIESTRAGMEQMIGNDEKTMNQTLGGWPCGVDDARSGYNGIKTTVRSQFQNVVTAGQNFGLNSSQTDQSVSIILGRVLSLQNSYQNVLNNLRQAQITPAGAVQQLRLNVTVAAWRDLATYARQQLGN